jgi:hypothetical protein
VIVFQLDAKALLTSQKLRTRPGSCTPYLFWRFRQVVFRQLLLTGAGLFTPFPEYKPTNFQTATAIAKIAPAELMMGSLSNKNCQMSASIARLPCELAVIDSVFEPDAMALYWGA